MSWLPESHKIELITYDPEDIDTYPSVCADAAEVEARFGFTGGETLVFDLGGSYMGELTKRVGSES